MKKIQIGGHQIDSKIRGYALVDNKDYLWLNQYKWSLRGDGYAGRSICGNNKCTWVSMHREILKAEKGEICDHKNGNPLDNRRNNIRICTHAENMRNKKTPINNTSGFKGVSKIILGGITYWRSMILINGKRVFLKSCKDKISAAKAYDRAAKKHFKKFARLNFPK